MQTELEINFNASANAVFHGAQAIYNHRREESASLSTVLEAMNDMRRLLAKASVDKDYAYGLKQALDRIVHEQVSV